VSFVCGVAVFLGVEERGVTNAFLSSEKRRTWVSALPVGVATCDLMIVSARDGVRVRERECVAWSRASPIDCVLVSGLTMFRLAETR
jgi:hypothetical protein